MRAKIHDTHCRHALATEPIDVLPLPADDKRKTPARTQSPATFCQTAIIYPNYNNIYPTYHYGNAIYIKMV